MNLIIKQTTLGGRELDNPKHNEKQKDEKSKCENLENQPQRTILISGRLEQCRTIMNDLEDSRAILVALVP